MKLRQTGYFVPVPSAGEKCQAFVPNPLPPVPPVQLDEDLQELMHNAVLSLGRLDGLASHFLETSLFLYMYVRKEALLSSQIEGTQSSLSDLLLFETKELPGVPLDDVVEVSNYVAAMDHGLRQLEKGQPLSLRLLREIHEMLLAKGRGSDKEPGEFRRSQNWLGGTRPGNAKFVPPPPELVMECMGALEKFLHNDPVKTPLLIKAALAHVQFETIHPFLDGNGRLGRLLITFLLCAEGALSKPMLYLSLYFKSHREEYYDLLQQVRTQGNWEAWLRFFFIGVSETASQAIQTSSKLLKLFEEDNLHIQKIGKAAGSALRVHQYLQRQPITSIGEAAKGLTLTVPTVTTAMMRLKTLGIVHEVTGKNRNRLFAYQPYIQIISEGTEPLR